MNRTRKIIGWSFLIIVLLFLLALGLVFSLESDQVKNWINTSVSKTLKREFKIHGDLTIDWRRNPDAANLNTWNKWLPRPYLHAEQITLDNPKTPEWQKINPQMASIDTVNFSIELLPLLAKKIVLPSLSIKGMKLNLERLNAKQNNWTFDSDSNSGWNFDLMQFTLSDATIQLKDPVNHIDLNATVNTSTDATAAAYGTHWNVQGSFNQGAIKGAGELGQILSLREENNPFPIQGKLQIGKTLIEVKGTVTKPRNFEAMDVYLKLSGPSMDNLFPLTGVLLPKTSPYTTQGRLIRVANGKENKWVYEKFRGVMGRSDLAGTLEFYPKEKNRSFLKGALTSNLLDIADLAPLIGADSNVKKTNRGASKLQPDDKLLPIEPFHNENWDSIDADVEFSGKKIVREKNLPIENMVAHIFLKDKVISLKPFNFGIAGGQWNSTVQMDGRAPVIKTNLTLAANHLQLQKLLPDIENAQATLGELNASGHLTGKGNSVGLMLGTAEGEIKAGIGQGQISKLLVEKIGLNLGNILLATFTGDHQIKLNCMASNFVVNDGLMKARFFVVDTDAALLRLSGSASLKDEQLGLVIQPKSKGMRIISLRSPIYVTGPFKHPNVAIDKGVVAMKAGGALALGLLAPVAALLPLINMGTEQESGCAK